MTKANYSKAELAALILETQDTVRNLLKSEDASLLAKDDSPKDEPSESAPPTDDASAPPAGDDASAPPADASAPPADASAPAAPPADASAPPADASAPPADGASPPADPANQSAGTPDSVESLMAAYGQLASQPGGDEVLKAHFMALKQVISQRMAATSAAPAPGAPPAAPGAPAPAPAPAAPGAPPAADPMAADPMSASPAPAPAAAPPPAASAAVGSAPAAPLDPEMAMKNEKEMNEKLAKSESEIAELRKSLEAVTKGFEMLMRKPSFKAIRGKDLGSLEKSEPVAVDVTKLSKAELSKALSDLAKNPDLKKSERSLINDHFARKVKVADLQVLFDKK